MFQPIPVHAENHLEQLFREMAESIDRIEAAIICTCIPSPIGDVECHADECKLNQPDSDEMPF